MHENLYSRTNLCEFEDIRALESMAGPDPASRLCYLHTYTKSDHGSSSSSKTKKCNGMLNNYCGLHYVQGLPSGVTVSMLQNLS